LQTARALRPSHPYLAARNPRFRRFVRVPEHGVRLRSEGRIVEETATGSVIAIRLMSDFVHRSGAVLQRDILHFEGEIVTSTSPIPLEERVVRADDLSPSKPCADPFVEAGSPVHLSGMFACIDDIRIGPRARSARFHIPETQSLGSLSAFLSPAVLLDALFRLLGVAPDGDVRSGAVSVPLEGGSFRFFNGETDRSLQGTTLTLLAVNPRSEGELLITDWGQVVDAQRRTIVSIERAVAQRMGARPARVMLES
jgi:hypothetical protein